MNRSKNRRNDPSERVNHSTTGRRTGVRAILFDKDGTLFDFRRTWLPIIREVTLELTGGDTGRAHALVAAAGYDARLDRFVPDGPVAAGSAADIVEAWCGLLPETPPATIRKVLDRYSAENGPRFALPVCDLPGLMTLLRAAGITLGLATSDSAEGARRTLARFGIEQQFSWVNGYDSGYGAKPDPAIVARFSAVAGVPPEKIAVVGDTLHDMRMGRRAGVAAVVGVLTGAVDRETLAPEADVIIESIAELPDLLALDSGVFNRH